MIVAEVRRLLKIGMGIALVLLLARCQKVAPKAPAAQGFDAPIPTTLSYLAGPISFRLSELENKINKELDPVLVGPKNVEEGKKSLFTLRVARSGPVQTQYRDQQVLISAPLQIWLLTPFSRDTVGRPFCALQVSFQSPLSVSSEWRLVSRIQFKEYKWISPPEIRLLGKAISLEKFVQRVLEKLQPVIESTIDAAIYKELRLDKIVRPIWRDIQKPLRIDRQFGLWVVPNPMTVAAGPIQGNKDGISVPLQIAFATQTVLKEQSPAFPIKPLPALQKKSALSQTSELRLMSDIPYRDINQMLQRKLKEQDVKIAWGLLKVKDASVYGGQHALIIRTELSGLINGTVYVQGRPGFDTLTNTLVVSKLDFASQLETPLPQKIETAIHDQVCAMLENVMKISLGEEIAQFPQKIDAAFDKSRASRKAALGLARFRFLPQRIAVRPNGIQALIKIESNVAVQVKNL